MRVLTVSRLCKSDDYKRIDLVIEAVKQLPFCTLTIVGDGDDRPRLMELAKGCTRIAFVGQVNDTFKSHLYEQCDVFCLPSTKEGFGLVFLEAMQHGKPCIGSKEGATREVLGPALLMADELDTLKDILTNCHEVPEARQVVGTWNRKRASEFSYDRFKARVKELLG